MIKVISAMFLKDTLASSAKDSEIVMAEKNRNPQYIKEIMTVFQGMDADNDGNITFHELYEFMQDEHKRLWLTSAGVTPDEVAGLFTLMDDGDNEISFCEFLTGIMRLKSANKGVDLATLLYENKKLLSRVLKIGKEVEKIRKDLNYM